MAEKFTIIIEEGEDGYLISEVVGLPGCHTQAKTRDELIKRTKEAIELYLMENKPETIKTKFLGLEQLEITGRIETNS
ncbi:MAG: type II toxin-antitoxin system HicB family antitoxin [Candidatus Aenigmarchaeota archaeon]|nr:type II toxin-antitoxin system HicB family antitoxin [Candidatus Aenigmarchaeota archaeon]